MNYGKWILVGISVAFDLMTIASFVVKARDGRVRLVDSVWLALCVSSTAFFVMS